MKKYIGILVIIFTFFLCDNLVNALDFDYLYGNNISGIMNSDSYTYHLNIYQRSTGTNKKALCLDPSRAAPTHKTSGWSTNGTSKAEAEAYNYILTGTDSDLIASITARLLHSHIHGKYRHQSEEDSGDKIHNTVVNTQRKFDAISNFSSYECKKIESPYYQNRCFLNTSKNSSSSSQYYNLETIFNLYKGAKDILYKDENNLGVNTYKLTYVDMKEEAGINYVLLKANFSEPLYRYDKKSKVLPSTADASGNTIYKIPTAEYPADGKFYISINALTLSVSIYYNTSSSYQTMLTFIDYDSEIDIDKTQKVFIVKACNVIPTLNPTSASFKPEDYINFGCSCKTAKYNDNTLTKGKYSVSELKNLKSDWISLNFDDDSKKIKINPGKDQNVLDYLVDQYSTICPPPCEITTACKGLYSTCDDGNLAADKWVKGGKGCPEGYSSECNDTTERDLTIGSGLLETFVKTSETDKSLKHCLESVTSVDDIPGSELLYEAHRNDNKGKSIYCLEKTQFYLGTAKVFINAEGGTFGVYPYIKSSLKECATSGKTIDSPNSFYNILNAHPAHPKYPGYYDEFVNGSIDDKRDDSTGSSVVITPKSINNLVPSIDDFKLEKFDKTKIKTLCDKYGISNITDLPAELEKYRNKDNNSKFILRSEKEMMNFDFDGSGKVDKNDVKISKNMISTFIDPDSPPEDESIITDDTWYNPTVYLYFLPKFLYTDPILGTVSVIDSAQSLALGYKYALKYNSKLITGKQITTYNLTINLYRETFNEVIKSDTTSDCNSKCSAEIYYKNDSCITESGEIKLYKDNKTKPVCNQENVEFDSDKCDEILCPKNNDNHCPYPQFKDSDGSPKYYIEYYNKDTTRYNMCNPDDGFNEVLCQEKLDCYVGGVGGIDYWYRPITLNDVFPNTANDYSKKASLKTAQRYRLTGSNWGTKKGRVTQKEIEKAGEKIYNNKNSWDEVTTNNTATTNPVYYKVTLTPQNMSKIRDYNDDQEDSKGYADFELTCVDGFACKSDFLTDLITKDIYGKYTGTWKDLTNAREWIKYTDGTAWK